MSLLCTINTKLSILEQSVSILHVLYYNIFSGLKIDDLGNMLKAL